MINKKLLEFGIENPVKIISIETKEINTLASENLDKYAEIYFVKKYWHKLEEKIKRSKIYNAIPTSREKNSFLIFIYELYLEAFKVGITSHIGYCEFAEKEIKEIKNVKTQ